MEIFSHPDIESILSIEGNNVCIDCGAAKPKWSSINNGVFLCLKCVNYHKTFGNQISIPRSLQIDSWDDKQIVYLKKGGNEAYKSFLKSYNIPLSATLDLRYKSKAMDYYRKYLRLEVEKELDKNYPTQEIDKPDLVTGLDLLDPKAYAKDSVDEELVGCQNPMMKPVKQENKVMESIGGFFAKAKANIATSSNKFSNWIDKITKKNPEPEEPPKGIMQNTFKGVGDALNKP